MMRRGGFTLLEVLAVVVLLALTAGLAASSLAGSAGAARSREAVQAIRWADAQARLRARSGAPVTLVVEQRELRVIRREDVLHAVDLPPGVEIALADPVTDSPVESVVYDRSGRTRDLLVRIRRGELSEEWIIGGVTGAMRRGAGTDAGDAGGDA